MGTKEILLLIILPISWIVLIFKLSPTTNADPSSIQQQITSVNAAACTTSNDFELAKNQSFGFFDDISATNWKRLQQIFMEHENHKFPEKPFVLHPQASESQSLPSFWKMRNRKSTGWFSVPAWYQTNYEPNFSCQFEKRVGIPMNGDGPKWICDPHRITKLAQQRKAADPNHPGCIIYSIGSNGDFSFELGMQQEVGEGVCEFHIFDMGDYETKVPKELKRAYYHRWGFKKQGGIAMQRLKEIDVNKFLGLKDTIKELGHENVGVIDIFKIDCERCEWETYKDWLSDDIPMLHQILVEVHGAPIDKALDFYDSLEAAGYLRFHKEPNIQWNPSCIEYAFVKVDKSFMEGKALKKVY